MNREASGTRAPRPASSAALRRQGRRPREVRRAVARVTCGRRDGGGDHDATPKGIGDDTAARVIAEPPGHDGRPAFGSGLTTHPQGGIRLACEDRAMSASATGACRPPRNSGRTDPPHPAPATPPVQARSRMLNTLLASSSESTATYAINCLFITEAENPLRLMPPSASFCISSAATPG